MVSFLKNELEKFKKILRRENTQYFVQDFLEDMRNIKKAALDITLYFLRNMKQDEAADTLEGKRLMNIFQINTYKCRTESYASLNVFVPVCVFR